MKYDRHSWCHTFYKSAVRDRPLLYDENYNKKRAWYGVSKALHEAVALYGEQDSSNESPTATILPQVLQQDEHVWGNDWMLPDIIEQVDLTKPIDKPDWSQGKQQLADNSAES
jgi:hypothetical protein